MARIFSDGFEYGQPEYAVSTPLAGYYGTPWYWYATNGPAVGIGTVTTTRNALSAYCVQRVVPNGGFSYAYTYFPSTYSSIYTRMYFNFSRVTGTGDSIIFTIMSNSGAGIGNGLASVRIDNTYRLKIYIGATLVGAYGAIVALNSWYLLETYFKASATVGNFTVKVDGTQIHNSGDANTGETNAGGLSIANSSPGSTATNIANMKIDCVAVNDDSGGVNNSWIGPGVITSLKPKAAGNYTQWTPNTGDNYAAVDETPKDDDTTYVESATTDQIDTYDLEELNADKGIPNTATVLAVSSNIVARYTDSSGDIQPVLRSGTTDHAGTQVAVGSAYNDVMKMEVFSVSPFTSGAWTVTEVDGLEAGIKFKG